MTDSTEHDTNGQTRFSFYNAEEYKVSPKKDNNNTNTNNSIDNSNDRFSFYDANEVQLTQTVVYTVEQQQQQQQQQQQNDEPDSVDNDNNNNSNTDSIQILKSLQEHEQQRLSILGGDEIEQQQQQQHDEELSEHNNPYQDAVLEALDILSTKNLGEQYAKEISQRREQRKIRMQKYASRLAELKQDMDEDNANNTNGQSESVERVLLAILERASSKEDQPKRDHSYEENKTIEDGDALLRAMSDLLGPKLSDDTFEASPMTEEQEEEDQIVDEQVVEEEYVRNHYIDEDEETDNSYDDGEQEEERPTLPPPNEIPYVEDEPSLGTEDDLSKEPSLSTQEDDPQPPKQETIYIKAAHQELDGLIERVFHNDQSSPETDKLLAARDDGSSIPESLNNALENHDDSDSYNETSSDDDEYQGVLGPLSKRTSSGVVLERQISVVRSTDDDEEEEEEEDGTSTSSSETEPTILESLSAAVSFMTGSKKDKYEQHGSDDDEEAELVKELCGHLLNKSRAPEWDDSDPDELGYRIVRLSTEQLQHVEAQLAKLLEERDFEDDLREAEKLFDEQNIVKPPKTPNADGGEPLENFPGVKSAGKGEMGDLEYFMLPVIFKSHVTGFEPTKDMLLEAGNVVAGQYLVEGVLGSAAFSTAYKCIDLSSEEDESGHQDEVCLKVIKNTKDFFDQSLDEIKILELLRQTGQCHDNFIVEMKAFFYHREHLIIVTELLRQNLFEFGKFIIDSGEEPYFTMTRLSHITRQCLIALKFVHSLGLVHSDVKPENILLSSYSRAKVKLIDFGSSCYLTDRQSSYIQSRSYRAPEVCLGLPYDGRIDIWSLGCVLAEMYTGEVIFQNDSLVSMLCRIEAICGVFPRHMIAQGRQSSRFFTKCGLLYEKVDDNRDDSSIDFSRRRKDEPVDIFQPKRTCLSARLGFAYDLMERYDKNQSLSRDEQRQAMFTDLVRKLLIIDPAKRLTAAEALEHPLMKHAATLTEDDVIYPSE